MDLWDSLLLFSLVISKPLRTNSCLLDVEPAVLTKSLNMTSKLILNPSSEET